MPKKIDLVGQKFGRLTVIKESSKRSKGGYVYWNCICDCGTHVIVSGNSLRTGHTKSCGCLNFKDITGQKFGRLVVIKKNLKRTKDGKVRWNCICECGNTITVRGSTLRNEDTKSCGCLQKEIASANCGENSSSWKPELTERDRLLRNNRDLASPGYMTFKNKLKKDRNYTCEFCGHKGFWGDNFTHMHHLESYVSNQELTSDPNNIIILCRTCHYAFHKRYGFKGNNTRAQYEEFLLQR